MEATSSITYLASYVQLLLEGSLYLTTQLFKEKTHLKRQRNSNGELIATYKQPATSKLLINNLQVQPS